MTVSVESAVSAHLDVRKAPAGPDRTNAIAHVYSSDVFIGEPDAKHQGHSGMAQAISALQTLLPGTSITRSGPIQEAQDLVTYTWKLGAGSGPVVATGRDVLILRDGQITSVYVLIDAA